MSGLAETSETGRSRKPKLKKNVVDAGKDGATTSLILTGGRRKGLGDWSYLEGKEFL